MTIKLIHQDLLDEIIEKMGSTSIINCDRVDCDPLEDTDIPIYNIDIDTNKVFVFYHDTTLILLRDENILSIDKFRYYEVIIL